jgi:hypothetical protein
MALIWFATEQSKTGNEFLVNQETASKLAALEHMIQKIIGEGNHTL